MSRTTAQYRCRKITGNHSFTLAPGQWQKTKTSRFLKCTMYTPSLRQFRRIGRDGKFPDGAVLVKEITNADAAKLTTGESSWSTDMKVWFVMIKDSKGRFPDNHLWGDGWGWALFKADDPKKNVATDFKTDCITCHIPAKQDDWIYTRGYPILKKTAAAP